MPSSALLRLVDIVESDAVETAAVECRSQPRLLVNPAFVERWAATPEKLLMLIMHELHHVLLGHTRLFPRVTRIDNLVFDAVINALLCRMFPAPQHTAFFTDFYCRPGIPGLPAASAGRLDTRHAGGCPARTERSEARQVTRRVPSPVLASRCRLPGVVRRLARAGERGERRERRV